MLVPLSWLKEYTEITLEAAEFAERMVMSGSNVEGMHTFGAGLSGIVVGRVLEVKDHENSDHLHVCLVDVGPASEGGAPLQIVCGAPNVAAGQLVPVAMVGAVLPDDFKIKRSKLRGVESFGMICSAQELGFDDKVTPVHVREGIWALPEDTGAEPGDDFLRTLGLDETVIDFEITPNRPDCLSIIGLAREAAATLNMPLKLPDTSVRGEDASACSSDHIAVEIRRPDLCPRYVARVAQDIVIQESPWWMQRRLMFAGMRPINNIVDITNYVMLEYGHPIHAFDIRQIAGGRIVVDTAAEGECFTTLDGTERTMGAEMLLIKDAEKGVAVAGVMGGLNSEIVEDTQTILVESANFEPDSVRRTSKALGVRTEASSRYEKGIAAELSGAAADRVLSLVAQTGAGRVLSGSVDCYPGKTEPKPVAIRVSRMNQVLGTSLSRSDMEGLLSRLEIVVAASPDGDENIMMVTPPSVRVDLKEEIDYTEEVARMYGYDRLEVTQHRDNVETSLSTDWRLRGIVRDLLSGIGYSEIATYSFVSPKSVDRIGAPEDSPLRSFVRLINPLGEENSVMRTTMLPSFLDILSGNYSRKNESVRLFEIGNVFVGGACTELPDERICLTLGGYGGEYGFFVLKGAVEAVLARLGIRRAVFEACADSPVFHPGRCARVLLPGAAADGGDAVLGTLGEVHPAVLEGYGIGTTACAADIELGLVMEHADLMRAYSPLGRFPAVTLDISLLAEEDVTVRSIEEICLANGGGILESVALFDVYRGQQIPEGCKSLSFSLVYRAPDRTLTDEEAGKVHARILGKLSEGTGATLRDA
ncbi:MAG: phenylalanine--tRNA ligase subunit beta [Clostridiales Family XIII bacterium]|jgi:phenylalanyl-tRNA synthetase beta chain|nr:phenylalanine--tRNA ligase subunit beta [Clostridiales Family XIII bacterium]